MPIVRASGLFRIYAVDGTPSPVLRDVDLSVEPGEFVAVMGPSGSGKSTLLHLLAGLDEPSAGTVELDGRDLAKLSENERTLLRRRTLGFIFQFFNLIPNLTVEENVALPWLLSGEEVRSREGDLAALLGSLGLAGKRRFLPHQLSGGEMQRASIARALAGKPKLLLADEPTGNLSSKAGEEVIALLRAARDREGRAVLLVTHNPRDAAAADRVLFLKDGVLSPEPVLRGPGLEAEDVVEGLRALGI
ncbi:MAG: ABC transporter ATP-binding protein [Planctomycetes bacterium]|nr:ABC transporter ATP-binding protein [Planctomycetota bacterium]